jgi:DNA repair protein RadA/Sms
VRAGRRSLAVGIQALVIPTDGPARRQAAGLDQRRFHIVAAVAERATGVRLIRSELIGATAGGLRVEDPAADLAVAAALVSASEGVSMPAGVGFAGEVSLTGGIRPVGAIEQRVRAAAAAGIERVVCAPPDADAWERAHRATDGQMQSLQIEVHGTGRLSDALAWAMGDERAEHGRAAAMIGA